MSLTLNDAVIKSFQPAKVFRSHIEPLAFYTSISFDDAGELAITSAQDDCLQLFNCKTAKHQKQVLSKKYGANLARFTHASSTVLYASTKNNHTLRYLSLHDQTFIRYYQGHTAPVNALELSPVDDVFLSASQDNTVRLWDLRSPNCQGRLAIAGHPSVSFDPSGLVFSVALAQKRSILLYDLRSFDKAPFASESIEDPVLERISWPPQIPCYTSCRFSNNGLHILLGTSGKTHYVLDSFTCKVLARLEGHVGLEWLGQVQPQPDVRNTIPAQPGASSEEVCWTPDSRYVLSGSEDGRIYVWDILPPLDSPEANNRPPFGPECTLFPCAVLDGRQTGSPLTAARCVSFNPKMGMFVSGGLELSFWVPSSSSTEPA